MANLTEVARPFRPAAYEPEHAGLTGLRHACEFVSRRWPVIGLTLLAVLLMTGITLDTITPRYTAHAEILLDPRREKSFGPDDTLHLISLDASDIDSAIVMIRANALLDRVVDAEHLASDPEFGGSGEDGRARALSLLARTLKVERISKAYALSISMTATTPGKAARLANAVADAFVRDQRDARLESSQRAASFFADRLAPLGEQLRRSEEALERFRRNHDNVGRMAWVPADRTASAGNAPYLNTVNTRAAASRGDVGRDGVPRPSGPVPAASAGLDTDIGPRLRELERVRLVDQTVFETYLGKARAAAQQSTFEDQEVRVISPAEPIFAQKFPQTVLTLVCMTVFGLGLGVGVGMALDRLDPGFLTPRHTEESLGMPVLAAVPWLRPKDLLVEGKPLDPCRYLAQRPHSRYAEAVHAIRAGIRMSEGAPAKIVLVTSSVQGEGKSVLAFSLALSAARAGQRVLLLDADLRQPALSRYFGFEHRLGLVDMLAGLIGTAETTIPLGRGLALMPSGRRSAVAPDLFASARMAVYLNHLRGIYDLVVVDAAPAGAVVDAKVLASLSDRILFVVGWRATARELVARNLRTLGHPAKVAGVVLNKFDDRRLPYTGSHAVLGRVGGPYGAEA